MKGYVGLRRALPLGDDVAGFLVDRSNVAFVYSDANGRAVEALSHRPTGPEGVSVVALAVAFADQIAIFGY